MLDLLTFRVIAGFLLIAFFVWLSLTLRYVSRGGPRLVPLAEKDEKALEALWLGNLLLAFLVVPALGVLLPWTIYGTVLNVAIPGDTLVQLAGLGLFVFAAALSLTSSRHMGRYMVSKIAIGEGHELVTTGPYARVRHPAYTSAMLLSLSGVLIYLNLLLAISFLVTVALAVHRAKAEEELLSSEVGFGSRYREYVDRTGRFFPRLR